MVLPWLLLDHQILGRTQDLSDSDRFRFLDVQGLVQKLNLISMKLE